jgi:hypothetical protein
MSPITIIWIFSFSGGGLLATSVTPMRPSISTPRASGTESSRFLSVTSTGRITRLRSFSAVPLTT